MALARPRKKEDAMSSIDRLTKYSAKLDPAHVATVLTALKPDMIVAETAQFADQENMESLTRATLATEGAVHTIQFPMYHAYVKELNRIQGTFHGGAPMMSEVVTVTNKWVSRGLMFSTLAKLALDIFDIVIPPTP
jgi:hypothetical protein